MQESHWYDRCINWLICAQLTLTEASLALKEGYITQMESVKNSVINALCLPLQAGVGGAVPAGGKRRLLHHPPPGSPKSCPGLAGRLDPHQGHPQSPAHPGHRWPAPAQATMTTAFISHTRTNSNRIKYGTSGKPEEGAGSVQPWNTEWDVCLRVCMCVCLDEHTPECRAWMGRIDLLPSSSSIAECFAGFIQPEHALFLAKWMCHLGIGWGKQATWLDQDLKKNKFFHPDPLTLVIWRGFSPNIMEYWMFFPMLTLLNASAVCGTDTHSDVDPEILSLPRLETLSFSQLRVECCNYWANFPAHTPFEPIPCLD